MTSNPVKKALCTLLCTSLLIATAACSNIDQSASLSNQSINQSSQKPSPQVTAIGATLAPDASMEYPQFNLKETYEIVKAHRPNGLIGFVFVETSTGRRSLEFTVPSHLVKSVNMITPTLIDVELRVEAEDCFNRHQYYGITYDTDFQRENNRSKIYENVISCSQNALFYLDDTGKERCLVLAHPIYDTLYEGTDSYRPQRFSLPDAADLQNPIVDLHPSFNGYSFVSDLTVYYLNTENKLVATTVATSGREEALGLSACNPYKTALQNVLRLNHYESSTSKYGYFCITDFPGKPYAELLLKDGQKLLIIDDQYNVYVLTDPEMERVYTDATYSWSKKTALGTERGLKRVTIGDGEWEDSGEGWVDRHDLYRVVEENGKTKYFVQESPTAKEREVTLEQFLAYSAQFGKKEVVWQTVSKDNVNTLFPTESVVQSSSMFTDYASILELMEELCRFCAGYHYIATPVEDYEVAFHLASEKEHGWFQRLLTSIDRITPASVMAMNYENLPGYCLKDLNGDGVMELLLLMKHWSGSASFEIVGVFTMRNGRPVMLDEYVTWIGSDGLLHGDYFLRDQTGWHSVYQVTENGFALVDKFGCQALQSGDLCYYKTTEEKDISISKAEFEALLQKYDTPIENVALCNYVHAGLFFTHIHKQSDSSLYWQRLFTQDVNESVDFESMEFTSNGTCVKLYRTLEEGGPEYLVVRINRVNGDLQSIPSHTVLEVTAVSSSKWTFDNGTLAGSLEQLENGDRILTVTSSRIEDVAVGSYLEMNSK